jgi:hypothetical protein
MGSLSIDREGRIKKGNGGGKKCKKPAAHQRPEFQDTIPPQIQRILKRHPQGGGKKR